MAEAVNIGGLLNGGCATKVVALDGSEITQELSDNTIYNCGVLDALDVRIPEEIGADYISQVNFGSGGRATELTAPESIVWDGDDINTSGEFEPEANMRYIVMLYTDGSNILGIVRGTAIPTTQSNND